MPLASIYSSTAARTPTISADVAGFPDLILVRPPRLVVAELKSVRGPVTARQQLWLDDVAAVPGIEVHVWRPDDWARYDSMVTRTLRISVGYYEAAKTAHDAIASLERTNRRTNPLRDRRTREPANVAHRQGGHMKRTNPLDPYTRAMRGDKHRSIGLYGAPIIPGTHHATGTVISQSLRPRRRPR